MRKIKFCRRKKNRIILKNLRDNNRLFKMNKNWKNNLNLNRNNKNFIKNKKNSKIKNYYLNKNKMN